MNRTVLVLAAVGLVAADSRSIRADVFDSHTNPVLQKGMESKDVKEVKQLTSSQAFQQDRALPGIVGTFLIVRTNEGRNAKLLVQWARQKTEGGKSIPMVLIERYACYREGEERTLAASGQPLRFLPGFRLSLDIGQLVPAELAADLACKLVDGEAVLEPVGKAKLYLVNASLLPKTTSPGAIRKPGDGPFDPKFFAGKFKLNDDGRKAATLEIQVKDGNQITGAYYSESTGQKYELDGKVVSPKNSIEFTVHFPRSEQVFRGWLFTGDAGALTGYATMQGRETGFYAQRVEEK
ncbi:hypothetical protein BH10PLA2_BH10PLA2_18250 [soil metagenome]